MGFIKEFKVFISRGNVIDLAVGVIIGGAFGSIVTSLVNDIFMPLLGILSGGIDLKGLSYKVPSIPGLEVPTATLTYGNFLQSSLDFVIKAFAIFLFVKVINTVKARVTKAEASSPVLSKEEILLTEIRDLLREKGERENRIE